MNRLDALKAVDELLASMDFWTVLRNAEAAPGKTVTFDDPKACRWCLGGAVSKICPDLNLELRVREELNLSLLLNFSWQHSIEMFNDSHGFDDVKALLQKTIQRVEASK